MSEANELIYSVNRRATINPYRMFAGAILRGAKAVGRRALWDINPESYRSRASLRKLKNSHLGQKAVILCNGPSLLKTDFDSLNGVFTFGLNKINLLFDKADFRPSCIVSVNSFVIEQNAAFFNATEIPLFISRNAFGSIKPRNGVTFLDAASVQEFARDCTISVAEGSTVTYVAMQLAFHMGFKEVALVGCDHSFATKGVPNATVKSESSDPNHFDPNYFAGGMQWQLPDLFQSEMSYCMARDTYSSDGRSLINATEGGKLELLQRKKLEDFLKE